MYRRDYMRRSLQASLAMVLVQSRPLVALVVIVPLLGVTVSSVVAVASTVAAVGVVVSTGCLVTSIKACAPIASESDPQLRTAVARELAAASWLGIVVFSVGACIALVAGWRDLGETSFFWYWLAALPALAIAPLGFVFSGVLRATGRDSLVLANAGITTAIYGCGVAAVAIGGWGVRTSLLGLGSVSTAVAVASLVHLGHRVRGRRLIDATEWKEQLVHLAVSARRIGARVGERAAASIDGVVFMVIFATATGIAASHSATAGVVVGLGVAVMRVVVVPIKQFGLVGAQMSLRAHGPQPPLTLTQVRWTSALVLVIATVAWVVLFLTVPALREIPLAIAVMMTIQILGEPWAGVHFSYRKVREGPMRGLGPLLVAYVFVGLVGLLVARGLDASAVGIWSVLFAARLVFAAAQARPVVQHVGAPWW